MSLRNKIISRSQAIEHLTGLQGTIVHDLLPAMNLQSVKGGYFSTPRLVMCYVDYLGYLYDGEGKAFSAVNYIRDIMGKIHYRYEDLGGLLYLIFRHGTVHEFMPKYLKYKRKRIGYLISKSKGYFYYKGKHYTHLKITNNIIPIALQRLYNDLIKSIDEFKIVVKNNSDVFKYFQKAYREVVNQRLMKINGKYKLKRGKIYRGIPITKSDLQDLL